jgi:hypothetical protein
MDYLEAKYLLDTEKHHNRLEIIYKWVVLRLIDFKTFQKLMNTYWWVE